MDHRPKCEHKPTKLLGKNICDFVSGKDFFKMASKAQSIKEKLDLVSKNCSSLIDICKSENTSYGEKTFANHSDIVFMSRV